MTGERKQQTETKIGAMEVFQTIGRVLTFAATVLSPLLLAWIGIGFEQHNKALDRRYQQQQDALARIDKLHQEDVELGKVQTALTKESLPSLGDKDHPDARRLAVLTMLAYVDRGQCPPFMLSVLAIQEAHYPDQKITDDLHSALQDLSEMAKISDVRIAASRALKKLPLAAAAETVVEVGNKVTATKEAGSKQASATAKAQLNELTAPLAEIATSSDQPDDLRQKARTALAEADQNAVKAALAEVPSNQKTNVPPRVYLQIANPNQREQLRGIQKGLIAKGYIVPGIQNVTGKAYIPDTLEVRCFDLKSKSMAQEILDAIKASGAKDGRVSYVIPTANDLRISSDIKTHFEVWAGRNSF